MRMSSITLFTYKSQMDTSNFAPIFSAGVAALTGDQSWLAERNLIYKQRRDLVVEGLREAGFTLEVPKAAIYVWAALPDGNRDSIKYCADLLGRNRSQYDTGCCVRTAWRRLPACLIRNTCRPHRRGDETPCEVVKKVNLKTNRSYPTHPPREKAFLVGVELRSEPGLIPLEDSLGELARLADTAGLDIVGESTQKLETPHPATYIGSGKVEEIRLLVEETLADIIIFDNELSPRHQRELEEKFRYNCACDRPDRFDPGYFCPACPYQRWHPSGCPCAI